MTSSCGVLIHAGGTVLDRVSSKNDLGVIMVKKITFLEHVDVMVAKAFAMLGFIKRLLLDLYSERLATRLWFVQN
jgi:hypothetical protein